MNNNDLTPERVVAFLQWHCQGADRGMSSKSLVECVTGRTSTRNKERVLREIISTLCLRGFPICSTPESGYWWATSTDEIQQICAYFRCRAMTSLRRIGNLKRIAIPILQGQLFLPIGAEPEIPGLHELKPVDFQVQPKVSTVVKIPEELHTIAQQFIQASGMNANEFYAKAVAYFLFQEGVIDYRDETSVSPVD